MSNYIIDPSVFYWIDVMGTTANVSAFFLGLFIIVSTCLVIGCIYNRIEIEQSHSDDNKKYLAICKRLLMITLPACIVSALLTIFLPSKTTSIEMLIARTATFDNVDWTVAQVKEIIDYITTALKGLV